jgi:hypothetical protein
MVDVKQFKIQFVTNETGEKTAVILPIEESQELLEDIEDLAAAAERREEPTLSHAELLAEVWGLGIETVRPWASPFCTSTPS